MLVWMHVYGTGNGEVWGLPSAASWVLSRDILGAHGGRMSANGVDKSGAGPEEM